MRTKVNVFLPAKPYNFNQSRRYPSSIKYIVIHYTGNVNDTAMNNLRYYATTNVGASAHYYCDDTGVYQSVADEHAAYSVGLGSMCKPYDPDAPFYKKATNKNSISIEICGSKTSNEGSEEAKWYAAKLCADLMERYNITLDRVIRHYDVTGKRCPAWAVGGNKWDFFKVMVVSSLGGNMDNYEIFKKNMARYVSEKEAESAVAQWEINAMEEAKRNGLINDGKPHSYVTRGELAVILQRLNGLHK